MRKGHFKYSRIETTMTDTTPTIIFYTFQFRLVLHYLCTMSDRQTLSLYSGHPMGIFPSHPDAPRAVITNGMVVPNYSSREDYDRMFALGNTM